MPPICRRVHGTAVPAITLLAAITIALVAVGSASAVPFPVVDTGQVQCYDATAAISPPAAGAAFFGQDAQYTGNQPSFTISSDSLCVIDNVTGLEWVRSPDTDRDGVLESTDKLSWTNALARPAALNAIAFGGHTDWRLPTIKELYSLIDFSGVDPSGVSGSTAGLVPFIDRDYFSFIYGDESLGERIIDSQYWSADEYVSTTMSGDHTVFGVNFADGRIKGYGTTMNGIDKTAFVQCVRGNTAYGHNDFTDNGDGTVTDQATGLMWMKSDSGAALGWQAALAYAGNLALAGHDDWRLPNAKELQGIIDYSRSPDTHGTSAIDPVFTCSPITNEGSAADFPCYWTGTTHANGSVQPGGAGVYLAFGRALGWMRSPFPPFVYNLMDVHGAGSQRSDPKTGDPADYPYGRGPQGDVIRIYNHVRCVRTAAAPSGSGDLPGAGSGLRLNAAPNPFNPGTTLKFTLPASGTTTVTIHDAAGRLTARLVSAVLPAGDHEVAWDGRDDHGRVVPSGVYLAMVRAGAASCVAKLTLSK